METQFDHERVNTERIRSYVLNQPPKHLKGGVAYVPDVYAGLSTERLLVLEFIEGVSTILSMSSSCWTNGTSRWRIIHYDSGLRFELFFWLNVHELVTDPKFHIGSEDDGRGRDEEVGIGSREGHEQRL